MMPFPVKLAHGALGAFDELIFLGIAVIFIVMMGVAWIRSYNSQLDLEDDENTEPDTQVPDSSSDAPEHVPLE